MTVCAPNSGKWPTIVEAINHYDKRDSIFETVSKIDKKTQTFRKSFENYAADLIMKDFTPELSLDHSLPTRLKLSQIETEVFYLLHIAYYVIPPNQRYLISDSIEKVKFQSLLAKRSGQESGKLLKDNICQQLANQTNFSCLRWSICALDS